MLALGRQFGEALATVGWRGPVNVACVHDGTRWLCLELNGRFSGGTGARTALGFDEVGWVVNAWARRNVVPPLAGIAGDVVLRQPGEWPLFERDVKRLAEEGRWDRGGLDRSRP